MYVIFTKFNSGSLCFPALLLWQESRFWLAQGVWVTQHSSNLALTRRPSINLSQQVPITRAPEWLTPFKYPMNAYDRRRFAMEDCIPVMLYEDTGNGTDDIFQYHVNHTNSSSSSWDTTYDFSGNGTSYSKEPHNEHLDVIEGILYQYVVTAICVVGILGNFLNLLVLTRKSLQKTMDRMEKSAHVGLIAMAMSDMFFCVAVLPHAWVPAKQFLYSSYNFDLAYSIYSSGIINTFIMSSTWLTVTIAASRYFAIVHPLRAREVIGMTFAWCSMLMTFIICVIFNLPRFWETRAESMDCTNGKTVYYTEEGYLKDNRTFQTCYMWVYFFVGIVIPVVILAYCNVYLIRALRHSLRMREQYQPSSAAAKESAHRITLTLVIIVLMYIVLVAPAEVINFFKTMVISQAHIHTGFNLAVGVLNTLQAVNFATNFILYCAVNTHFRKTVKELFCSCGKKREKMSNTSGWYESVSATTTVWTHTTRWYQWYAQTKEEIFQYRILLQFIIELKVRIST